MVAMSRAHTGQCESDCIIPLVPSRQRISCQFARSNCRASADRNRLMRRVTAQTLGRPAAAAAGRWCDWTLSLRLHCRIAHDPNGICETTRGETLAEFGGGAVTDIRHHRRLWQIVG
jgi:hypothetical protein